MQKRPGLLHRKNLASDFFIGNAHAASRPNLENIMPRKRFIVPWTGSEEKPALYHCVSRIVDRRYALLQDDKEKFRSFMRMYEKFMGCRVLTYCLMSTTFTCWWK